MLTLIRREDRMLQGFVGIVEPMDTLLIIAERRCEMKKLRSCRTKPQPRKSLRSPKITTRDEDLPGNWTGRNDDNGAMMSTPQFFTRGNLRQSNQNSNNFRQKDLSNGETTRITTIIGIMNTEQTHYICRT